MDTVLAKSAVRSNIPPKEGELIDRRLKRQLLAELASYFITTRNNSDVAIRPYHRILHRARLAAWSAKSGFQSIIELA